MKPILLVEDNADDVDLTLHAFKHNRIQHEVVVARDGVLAVDYLFGSGQYEGRDPSDLPMLVLLDLNLPRLSGLEVLRRIRRDERTRLLPVVILTSSREQRDVLEGYGHGANSYIVKPVDFDQFLKASGLLGVYWLTLNEPLPARC